MTTEEEYEKISDKCEYYDWSAHICKNSENNCGHGLCNEFNCPLIEHVPKINKYIIKRCISCPAECPLPLEEIYDNPHVCPHDESVEADFRTVEIDERDLLKLFKRIKDE